MVERIGRDPAFGLLFVKVEGQPVFRAQLCRIETGAQFLQCGDRGGIGAGVGCLAIVVPSAIIGVLDAAIGFGQR